MKINVQRIPPEGLVLRQEFLSGALDLDTEGLRYESPVYITAEVTRITNAVTIDLSAEARLILECSRCLKEIPYLLRKDFQLNYSVEKSMLVLDISSDIREEIILDYPMQPLCSDDCKGLCLKCGKNLNEGGCTCGST